MQSPIRRRVGMLAAGSVVLAGLGAGGAGAVTPAPTPRSTSITTGHATWVAQAYDLATDADLTPAQSDVAGPQRAPFGSGSHRIAIGTSDDQTELYRTNAYDGTTLDALTRLEYSTLARRTDGAGDLRQPSYLRLNVDTGGTADPDTSLFFFPANNADQQAVANGTWQTWDVAGGKLNEGGDGGATTTLAAFAAAHTGAKLANNNAGQPSGGGLALLNGGSQGGTGDPQVNGEYFVDRVVVGKSNLDTLFDLGDAAEATGGTTTSVVTPSNVAAQGLVQQAYDGVTDADLTSTQTFVDGPAAPPTGGGSLRFAITDGTNPNRIEQLRTPSYDGTLLRDFRGFSFHTFQRGLAGNATPQQPVYLRLNVDNDGDGTRDTSLYFVPADNGTVQQGAWQKWSAAQGSGRWSVDSDTGAGDTVRLGQYVVAHPDAKIVNNAGGTPAGGGVSFIVGGGGDGQRNGEFFLDDVFIGKVDAGTGHTVAYRQLELEPTPPTASIGDVSVSEGNNGATLRFPVTLSRAFARPVSVRYATSNGTAKSGSDYAAKSGLLTIPAGATTGTIAVPVLSDKVREYAEKLSVKLSSPSYATIVDGTGVGTIVNDDTRTGIALARASKHRVRAYVTTVAAARYAPVWIYRVTRSGQSTLLKSHVNRYGRISVVLRRHYAGGTKVTLYGKVKTSHGYYSSPRKTITVRR